MLAKDTSPLVYVSVNTQPKRRNSHNKSGLLELMLLVVGDGFGFGEIFSALNFQFNRLGSDEQIQK